MPTPYQFLDFPPAVEYRGIFSGPVKVETVQETLSRVNEWVVQSEVQVVNIETIIMSIFSDSGRNDFWYSDRKLMQVVRVWYQELA